jgi:hypothetical protein
MPPIASLSLLLACLVANTVVAAAPKAGSACPKLNQKTIYAGYTYTCIKSGKKLIWDKGVRVLAPVANPSPTPQVTPSPTPTVAPSPLSTPTPTSSADSGMQNASPDIWAVDNTLAQIENASQNDFVAWAKSRSLDTQRLQKVHFEIDPATDQALANRMVEAEKYEISLFGNDGPSEYYEFIGATQKWIINRENELGLNLAEGQLPCGPDNPQNSAQGCSNAGNAAFIILHNPSYVATDNHPLSVGTHEYFHSVQGTLLFGSTQKTTVHQSDDVPAWFIEGTAEWIGLTVWHYVNHLDYVALRNSYLQLNAPNVASNPLSDYRYNAPADPSKYLYPYTMGRSAIEFLVSKVGVSGMLNVMRDYKNSQNFDKAFKEATGISTDSFYTYFESARAALALPPATMHFVCGKNSPISVVSTSCP